MNFDNIEYLQHGNDRQRQAYSVLTNNQVLSKLKQFDPRSCRDNTHKH